MALFHLASSAATSSVVWTSIPCVLLVLLWPLLARYMSPPPVGGLLAPGSGPEGSRGSPISLPPTVPRTGHGLERCSMSHMGDVRQGCSIPPCRGLPVAEPPPAALPPCLWKGPPLCNRTARSRRVCSLCFAPRGGRVFGGDAGLCCLPDAPSGHRRVPEPPLPRSARCLCCRILFWFYDRFAFARNCRRGRQRCLCCPRFALLLQGKQNPPGGQTPARPPNAAPMPPGPEFQRSPECSRSGTDRNPSPPAGAAWQAVLPAALPAPAPRHLPWQRSMRLLPRLGRVPATATWSGTIRLPLSAVPSLVCDCWGSFWKLCLRW